MENNPIKYSDLVKPDSAITDLIKQLEDLAAQYSKTSKSIKDEAASISDEMRQVSGATAEGRAQTQKMASDADRLAKAERDLAFAESKTAKQIAELKEAQREANNINKLTAKLNNNVEGSYNRLSAQYSLNKIKLNQMSQAERETTEAGKKLERETAAIYERMKQLQEATGKFTLNVGNYKSALQGLGNITANLGRSLGAGGLGGQMQSMMGSLGGVAGGLGGVAGAASAAAGPIALAGGAALALGTAMVDGIGTAKDYEKALSVLSSVTGESKDALKILSDEARRLGASTAYTATEVTELQIELAKLGYAKGDIKNMTEQVLYFAQATGASLADASSLTGAALRMFEASTEETQDYVDKMAASTTKSALSFEYLNTALATVSPVANSFGFSIDEVLALLGSLANAGFDASTAATATRNIFLKLADANGDLAQAMGGPVTNLDELVAGLNKLNADGIDLATSLELTGERSVAAFNTFLSGADSVKALKDELNECNGVAKAMSEVMADNLEGDIASLGSAWDDFMIEINDGQGVLRGIVKWLTEVVRGISDWYKETKNNIVELWNNSAAFRAWIAGLATEIKITWDATIDVLKAAWNIIAGLGNMLIGILTLDWDQFQKGLDQTIMAIPNAVSEIMDDVVENVEEGIELANKKLEPIKVKVETEEDKKTPTAQPAPATTPTTPTTKLTDKEIKEAKKKREELYKKNLQARRKAEDEELNLIEDEFRKRTIKTNLQYSRQIEDLKHYLKTESDISKEERESINAQISALEQQQTNAIIKIEEERALKELEMQKKSIELRLRAVAEGSEEEKKLRLEALEVQKQIELAKDKTGDKASIEAAYKKEADKIADSYKEAQLAMFDQQQELAMSEFDLMRNSEERKTRFRLQAEKDRLQKILELNEQAGTKLSDAEVQTIKNTMAKIDQEIEQSKGKERGSDIYGLFGLNIDNEQKEAINTSVQYATDALNTYLDAYQKAADAKVSAADKEVESARKVLDSELEARANGYANNVEYAQKELDNARKNQEKALKDQQKAQKAQQAIQAIQQVGDLVTATAKIWAQLGFPGAIPATAVMWGAFAAAKIKAMQMTKQSQTYGEGGLELLGGGSHQSGNDVDLGTMPDGRKRRAEGGEFVAIINKRNSRRYRDIIPDVVNSLNQGTFETKYLNAFSGADNLTLNVNQRSADLRQLSDDVHAIKEQGISRSYTEPDGTRVTSYKNLTRRIK